MIHSRPQGSLAGFCWRHSLSLSLAAGFFLFSIVAYALAPDKKQFWYDWFIGIATALGSGAGFAVLYRVTWEKDADPTKEPE